MPTETEIQNERQRLYESAALREDLNDDEATVLLEWGETHVVRLAQDAADSVDLEQRARFLRQLLKHINRFVGQRQYNNRDEQIAYLEKVVQWLPKLEFKVYKAPDLLEKLPPDAADMAATLRALLEAIDPKAAAASAPNTPQRHPGNLQDAVNHQIQSAADTPSKDNLQNAVQKHMDSQENAQHSDALDRLRESIETQHNDTPPEK